MPFAPYVHCTVCLILAGVVCGLTHAMVHHGVVAVSCFLFRFHDATAVSFSLFFKPFREAHPAWLSLFLLLVFRGPTLHIGNHAFLCICPRLSSEYMLSCCRFREQLPPSRDEKKTATHVETITRAVQSKSRRKRKVRPPVYSSGVLMCALRP